MKKFKDENYENYENCIRCGKPAKIIQSVYIDGTVKKVSYCESCFVEIMKYESEKYVKTGVRVLTNHIKLVQESPVKNFNFEKSIEDIYSVLPSTIQLNLFKQEPSSYKSIAVDIKNRKLALLNHRLKKALKRENYKQAEKIKKKMEEIRKTLEQQPW
ncbi:MAG: hypothetical protein ACK4E1_03130 [Fervidobacterium nodosum]